MFKKQRTILAGLLIVLILAFGSCKSKFEKLKASNDNAKKYQEAIRLYNKKDYSKALELFDTLVTALPRAGTSRRSVLLLCLYQL